MSDHATAPGEWQEIKNAPKDGRIIKVRQGDLAPFRAFWDKEYGRWLPVEFLDGLPATHWLPEEGE